MNRKLGWILVFSLGLAAAAHGQPARLRPQYTAGSSPLMYQAL